MIHVFIGTKAQYIKTAPVLRELDARGIPYRLIDSGQHGALSVELRRELGLRDPDFQLGTGRNIATIPQAIAWAARIALLLFQRKRVRMEIFDDIGGACVVHGDTPSTLLSALLARRAGLAVAHLEAGLTSGDWRHPFPEEIIRRIVHGRSDVLFAPSSEAFAHLQGLGLRGHIIQLPANTGIESVHWSGEVSPRGPVVMTTHRVENLRSAHRMRAYVELVGRIAESHAVLFVMHDPTEAVLRKLELLPVLESMRPRVELAPLMAHGAFVEALASAPFVVTDGGSIQEELAVLGVPTLLWRKRTERQDGLGRNVILSRFDPRIVDTFLADFGSLRCEPLPTDVSPSRVVVDTLLSRLQRE